MKPTHTHGGDSGGTQPPSGGCVLKHGAVDQRGGHGAQPPSGGCVLKHERAIYMAKIKSPAAFGRLCVET